MCAIKLKENGTEDHSNKGGTGIGLTTGIQDISRPKNSQKRKTKAKNKKQTLHHKPP